MLDLTDVILTEGKKEEFETGLNISELSYRTGTYRVAGSKPLHLSVENLGEQKLFLSGSVDVSVEIPCARCLKPVIQELPIAFDFETGVEKSEYIDGYKLDVDQLIHDEALLVWPERVLCREDCKGLCSTCGQDLNLGPCGCEAPLDPRMAKILDIFQNFKEV